MKAIRNDLLRWTCERHAGDHPVNKRLLRDKALELAGEYGLTGTYPSNSRIAEGFGARNKASPDRINPVAREGAPAAVPRETSRLER
jgi:hypothetical protein